MNFMLIIKGEVGGRGQCGQVSVSVGGRVCVCVGGGTVTVLCDSC